MDWDSVWTVEIKTEKGWEVVTTMEEYCASDILRWFEDRDEEKHQIRITNPAPNHSNVIPISSAPSFTPCGCGETDGGCGFC